MDDTIGSTGVPLVDEWQEGTIIAGKALRGETLETLVIDGLQ